MKSKRFFGVFITVATIGLIIMIIIILNKQTKITYNKANVYGNSSGNLLNGGLYCQLKDRIYFSNLEDEGSLYSMSLEGNQFEKLTKDRVKYINGAGDYIYYTRKNNEKEKKTMNSLDLKNSGMYRINKDGLGLTCIFSGLNENMKLYGNDIYYEYSTKKGGLSLHKIKIDGKEEVTLSDFPISPASIVDGIAYYSDIQNDFYIHSYDLATGKDSILLQEKTMNTILFDDDIYYMSLSDNYGIKRVKKDGTNSETLVAERSATYNLSMDGEYLYYQVDDAKNNGIYMLNINTKEVHPIILGDFNHINITSNYVFFQEFHSNNVFYIPVGEEGKVSSFNPPVLK